MKAKHAFIALVAISVMLFPSCEESADHATLRVNLRQDRSIVPEDFPLEIDSYRITGDGPGSESFSVETDNQTVSLEGLIIGEWHITAEGLNKNNDVLVTGEADHRLSATNGSCTIVLENLVGTGSLEVSLSWDPERIAGEATVELELTPQYGTEEKQVLELTEIDAASGSASYSGSGYPSGSYVLSARLYDGDVQVAGFVEAVRIAGEQVSKGAIRFDLDKYPIEPGTLELVNKTGVPVSCTIEGITDTVDADVPISVSITSEMDEVGGYSIIWYLDGNLLGDGATIEFTPSAGTHRLDVVASTSRLGTSGSTSINFEAVSKSLPGVPVKGSVVNDGDYISLSGSTVIEFLPDGNAMIVSNAEEKVYIASMIRSSLNIEREYTFTDLGITGEVVDFDSAEFNANLTKVILGQNNPCLVIVYNYNPATVTLTKFSDGTPQYMFEDSTPAEEINSVGIFEEIKKDGYSTGAVMIKGPTDHWQYSYVSLTDSTGDSEYFRQGMTITMSTTKRMAGKMLSSPETFFHITEDGYGLMMVKRDSATTPILNVAYYFNPIILPGSEKYFTDIYTTTMLDPLTVLLFTQEYMVILEQTRDQSDTFGYILHDPIPFSHEAAGVITSKDYKFVYYIDIDTDEIVTLEISPDGTEIEEIGRTELTAKGMDALAISDSGINLIAYDEDNATSLMILRATR